MNLCLFFLFIILSSHLAAQTEGLPENKDKMNKLLQQQTQKLQLIKKEERSLLKKIDDIQQELFSSDKELVRFQYLLAEREKELNELRESLSRTRELADNQQLIFNRLSNQLYRLYAPHKGAFLETLFRASSSAELDRNIKLSEIFIGSTFKIASELNNKLEMQKTELESIEESSKILTELKNQQALIKKTREKKKQELISFLKNIESRKSSHLRYIEELKLAQDKLDNKIDSLRTLQADLKGLEKLQGQLPWPIEGKITRNYGRHVNQRFNTVQFNKGILITGSPNPKEIKAVQDALVVYSDWFKGYGNLIILNHGADYYSLYSRISSRIKQKGDQVSQGDVLGLSDTDEEGKALVYFELRLSKKTLNPKEWLTNK